MPKQGTIEQIKEYNKNKQAWSRAKKKGISLTWGEWCSEIVNVSNLSNLTSDNHVKLSQSVENVKPELIKLVEPTKNVKPLKEIVSSQETVKPDKSLTSESLTNKESNKCQTTKENEAVKPYSEIETNQFLNQTKLTETEKELIKQNKCSTYEWDYENKRHKCFTCSYHRNRNWLFSLDSRYCKDKEELSNFIQEARKWKRDFIDTSKSKSEHYNQTIIKVSEIEINNLWLFYYMKY